MSEIRKIRKKMQQTGWFADDGCYVLFDGQFGSTGKGLLASVIAEAMGDEIDTITTNAGTNSGHTGYFLGEKIMTQQLPVASIVMERLGIDHVVYLNAGAVIEPDTLRKELEYYKERDVRVFVHPDAPVVMPEHKGDQLSRIASTGKGVGFAMADKINRVEGATFKTLQEMSSEPFNVEVYRFSTPKFSLGRCFVETAQGWSLGINSGFYPYTTSRECSVSQALSDLCVSPRALRKSIATLRTYPIRVGNTPDGYSGDVYPDQQEVTFDDLGQEPELTTVTQRVRRIFTWSWQQYREMLHANQPDALFINFMNYLPKEEHYDFVMGLIAEYRNAMGFAPEFILGGYGKYNAEVRVVFDGDFVNV